MNDMNEINKLKILYAFDNENQFKLFRKSIKTVMKFNNNNEISFVFLFPSEFEKYVENKLTEIAGNYEFENIVFESEYNFGLGNKESSRHAMFYWLFAPFRFEDEFLLQLDNDTLVFANFKKILKNNIEKLKKNLILAAKTNIRFQSKIKNSLNILSSSNDKLNFEKYTNYGVVFLNSKNFKNIFKNENELVNFLKNKTLIAEKNNITETDQEYMFEVLSKKTIFLPPELNTRIHNIKTVKKALKNDEKIIHLNLWNGHTKKKFDFVDFLYSEKTDDEKANELWNFFMEKMKNEFHMPNWLVRKNKNLIKKITMESLKISYLEEGK